MVSLMYSTIGKPRNLGTMSSCSCGVITVRCYILSACQSAQTHSQIHTNMPDLTTSKCFQPLASQKQDKCARSFTTTGEVRLRIVNMLKHYAMIKDAEKKT